MSRSSRLRRLNRSTDSLDLLLADALRHQVNRFKGKGSVKDFKAIEASIHEQYTNPLNWEDKGIVMVIYFDESTCEQSVIGFFQDSVHKRTAARRLQRITDDRFANPGAYNVKQEVDTDPFLVHGKVNPCPPSPPQSVYERQAIRDYLKRVEDQRLDELLGVSKHDAAALLKQLKDMGVEKLR